MRGGERVKVLTCAEILAKTELEVIECDCGFHLGIDGSWLSLEEAKGFEMECPACHIIIKVDELTRS